MYPHQEWLETCDTVLWKVILVTSDEKPVYIEGPLRHDEHITAAEGAPAHELSKMVAGHGKFTIQLLEACSSDINITRSCTSFVKHKDIE